MKQSNVFKLTVVLFAVLGLLIATSVTAAAKAEQQTFQGVLEKGEKGITIFKTDDGQSLTIVGQNLAEMIGKKVKITGMLTKSAKNRAIVVSTFEEVKE